MSSRLSPARHCGGADAHTPSTRASDVFPGLPPASARRASVGGGRLCPPRFPAPSPPRARWPALRRPQVFAAAFELPRATLGTCCCCPCPSLRATGARTAGGPAEPPRYGGADQAGGGASSVCPAHSSSGSRCRRAASAPPAGGGHEAEGHAVGQHAAGAAPGPAPRYARPGRWRGRPPRARRASAAPAPPPAGRRGCGAGLGTLGPPP